MKTVNFKIKVMRRTENKLNFEAMRGQSLSFYCLKHREASVQPQLKWDETLLVK